MTLLRLKDFECLLCVENSIVELSVYDTGQSRRLVDNEINTVVSRNNFIIKFIGSISFLDPVDLLFRDSFDHHILGSFLLPQLLSGHWQQLRSEQLIGAVAVVEGTLVEQVHHELGLGLDVALGQMTLRCLIDAAERLMCLVDEHIGTS